MDRGGGIESARPRRARADRGVGALGALAYALWRPADDPRFTAVAYGAALAAMGAGAGRVVLRW